MGDFTFRAALAELFTEVLSCDTGAGGVTWLPRVVTWLVVVHVIGRAVWRGGSKQDACYQKESSKERLKRAGIHVTIMRYKYGR